MNDYIILVDATSDLSKELRERFNIEYIKFHVCFPNGKEYISSLKWDFISKEDFFKELRATPNKFTTSPPSIDEFKLKYEEYLKQGKDILYISISSSMSGTFNFASRAKDEIQDQYPDRKIICIDSQRYSTACGLLAITASELRKCGKTIEEVAKYLEDNKNRVHQMGPLDDLSFLAKKGRISHAAAFMGKLIGIKPLGDFSSTGKPSVLGKAKGEKNAFEATLKYIEATIENPQNQIIFIAHTNRPRQLEQLKKLVEERIKPREVVITDIYLTNCINIGPGLAAVYYYGKPISEDLEAEKKLMDSILK